LLALVASYFTELFAIYYCFKSTSIPITVYEIVETVGPKGWDLSSGWSGFIIVPALAIFGYQQFIGEENDLIFKN
jgi:hypothetical protein